MFCALSTILCLLVISQHTMSILQHGNIYFKVLRTNDSFHFFFIDTCLDFEKRLWSRHLCSHNKLCAEEFIFLVLLIKHLKKLGTVTPYEVFHSPWFRIRKTWLMNWFNNMYVHIKQHLLNNIRMVLDKLSHYLDGRWNHQKATSPQPPLIMPSVHSFYSHVWLSKTKHSTRPFPAQPISY